MSPSSALFLCSLGSSLKPLTTTSNWGLKGLGPLTEVEVLGSWVGPK